MLSTNGTLIDRETAERLKDLKFAYVGISLDSAIPAVHDEFRGVEGRLRADDARASATASRSGRRSASASRSPATPARTSTRFST